MGCSVKCHVQFKTGHELGCLMNQVEPQLFNPGCVFNKQPFMILTTCHYRDWCWKGTSMIHNTDHMPLLLPAPVFCNNGSVVL